MNVRLPLSAADATELSARIGAIPAFLEQARGNLADGDARDLWLAGLRSFRGQSADLAEPAEHVAGTSADLDDAIAGAIAGAIEATDAFHGWLEAEAPSEDRPVGRREG